MKRSLAQFIFQPVQLACILALLAGAQGCSSNPDTQVDTAAIPVQTAHASLRTMTDVVHTEGVLFPVRQASLSPKISAPVRIFYVNRGSHVHVGELLAVLENKDLAAGVIAAQGAYQQAQATYATTTASTLPEEIQSATLNAKDAATSLAEQQQLFDSESRLYQQGALARRQLDATEVALTAASSVYQAAEKRLKNLQTSGATQQQRAAKGQLESAHGQYLGAAAQLNYTELRSPIGGVIADRAVYPGDIAPAGVPLLIVMDTSKVIARVHIPQSQAYLLHLGDTATLHVPGLTATVPGTVTVISPAVDPNSTTVEVWVEADNPQDQLHPGTSLDVLIEAQTIRDALTVPETAILTGDDGKTQVTVVGSDNRSHMQAVTTGIHQGALVQILSGLRPGEQVIVSGGYGLPDNSKVRATADSGPQF
jgi:HlyD family secretion protein